MSFYLPGLLIIAIAIALKSAQGLGQSGCSNGTCVNHSDCCQTRGKRICVLELCSECAEVGEECDVCKKAGCPPRSQCPASGIGKAVRTVADKVDTDMPDGSFRIYQFEIPLEGVTLELVNNFGSTAVYYSTTFRAPSSALYDGTFNGSGTAFIPKKRNSKNSVWARIMPLQRNVSFTIKVRVGDWTGTT